MRRYRYFIADEKFRNCEVPVKIYRVDVTKYTINESFLMSFMTEISEAKAFVYRTKGATVADIVRQEDGRHWKA